MRNHALTLRLNDDEWEHLKNLVEATDYTTQTFLRKMILGEEVKPKRPEQFRDLLTNARQTVKQTDIDAIQEMQSKIWMKVKYM